MGDDLGPGNGIDGCGVLIFLVSICLRDLGDRVLRVESQCQMSGCDLIVWSR